MSTITRARWPKRSTDAPEPLPDSTRSIEIDTPTLVIISAMAWVTANVFHEILGHAGAAVVLGIPVRAISTTTAFVEWDAIESMTQDRIINAAATPVNILTGALALLALRWLKGASVPTRYFLWLFATVSFTMATWNMVTLPLLGAGDWGEVVQSLGHTGLWTAGVVAVGIVLAVLGFRLPLRLFLPDLSDKSAVRHKIIFVPVTTMIVVQTLSVALSPFATAPADQNHLLASVFAYVHLVIWAFLANRGTGPRSTRQPGTIALERSTNWLVAGIVVVIVFIAVLGPGVGPLEDDPRLDALAPASVIS